MQKNQWAEDVVNFLNFSEFGKNQELDEEMKKAKEEYKRELSAAGCKFDYNKRLCHNKWLIFDEK